MKTFYTLYKFFLALAYWLFAKNLRSYTKILARILSRFKQFLTHIIEHIMELFYLVLIQLSIFLFPRKKKEMKIEILGMKDHHQILNWMLRTHYHRKTRIPRQIKTLCQSQISSHLKRNTVNFTICPSQMKHGTRRNSVMRILMSPMIPISQMMTLN